MVDFGKDVDRFLLDSTDFALLIAVGISDEALADRQMITDATGQTRKA